MKKSAPLPLGVREGVPGVVVSAPKPSAGWTFLTNHTHVLLCLYRHPDQRLRDVATAVGITERMVPRVVAELVTAGYLKITKEGRCNRYAVNEGFRLRHPLEIHNTIGELLNLLSSDSLPKN